MYASLRLVFGIAAALGLPAASFAQVKTSRRVVLRPPCKGLPEFENPLASGHHGRGPSQVRIPGQGEKDSGVNAKTIPG
jgi:hypothetical protein